MYKKIIEHLNKNNWKEDRAEWQPKNGIWYTKTKIRTNHSKMSRVFIPNQNHKLYNALLNDAYKRLTEFDNME